MKWVDMSRKLGAETIGTFVLTFAGVAAVLSTQASINCGAELVGIALALGLALAVAVNAFSAISNAHVKPAVTIRFSVDRENLNRRSHSLTLLPSWLAPRSLQWRAKQFFQRKRLPPRIIGIPTSGGDWIGSPISLRTELILAFLLMIANFGTAVDQRGKVRKIGGFGIGLTVTFDILAGGPVTGAAMNPARSFGPALIQGDFQHHIYYWIGPITGMIVTALIYQYFLLKDENDG